jgi:hypothetical protein
MLAGISGLTSYIILYMKGLLGTNTLAYFALSPIKKVKKFLTLALGVNGIKLFSFYNIQMGQMHKNVRPLQASLK